MENIKEEAKKLVDKLPDDANWDDLIYEIYVRKKISKGRQAVEENKLIDHEDLKSRFNKK